MKVPIGLASVVYHSMNLLEYSLTRACQREEQAGETVEERKDRPSFVADVLTFLLLERHATQAKKRESTRKHISVLSESTEGNETYRLAKWYHPIFWVSDL